MAKILVADDNSNIQKMVGLALKDQGIDVVAVGNGEAAVRKISDIRPDLVLADVFMPVRNGYEVCRYVKEDSSLAHIPVILLVGAFDPLDEQEGLVQIINFLQQQPDWKNTLVIITYDDSDGWYDHLYVKPTSASASSVTSVEARRTPTRHARRWGNDGHRSRV